MIDKLKFVELMSARMFHDLAGPVGAVNNSIEFFEDENPLIKSKALEIIKSSSEEAIARLKFFRYAYGILNDKESIVDEIDVIISEFLAKTKVKLKLQKNNLGIIKSSDAKIILNLVIISLSSMIYGGEIEVSLFPDELKIKFNAEKLILSDEVKALLNGDLIGVNLSSSNIQVYYAHMIISETNYKLSIKQSANNVEFTFK